LDDSGFAGGASCRIALGFARLFVGVSVAAASAFDPIEFAGRYQIVAFVTAGQMPADFEVSDHGSSPPDVCSFDITGLVTFGHGFLRKNPSVGQVRGAGMEWWDEHAPADESSSVRLEEFATVAGQLI